MKLNEPVILIYLVIYLAALALAVWRRKTFPLAESVMVMILVGLGFTGLVYLFAPAQETAPVIPAIQPSELIFTLAYLGVVAALLIPGPPIPNSWKDHFFKRKLAIIIFKLLVFVLVPLVITRLFWSTEWSTLGFSAGNVGAQLRTAAILIFFFGGFNLVAGGGAAPIRARQFSMSQVITGMGLAFLWNIVEVGLVEEFFFRGFLQTRLISFFGMPASGIAATSLLFGLAHVPGIYLRRGDRHGPLGDHPTLIDSILYAILVLSPTGWFTGLLFWRTQSLLAPILVHAAVDAVAHAADFLEGLGLRKRNEPEASA